MDIAIQKRRDNIAEYILYLWQLEDMMRALGFSPEAVYARLVQPRGLAMERENELLVWYMGIADLIRQEGKTENGHLDHTMHLIAELQKLHDQLLQASAGEEYRRLFLHLAPELPRLREIIGKEDIGDIELAFRALYATMLYRMRGGETVEKTASDVVELVSPLMSELARVYHLVENGQLDLHKE